MKFVLLSNPGSYPLVTYLKKKEKEAMFRDEEGTDFLEKKTVKVSQTDAYLYLFALHYMNYRVALVSWSEMPMGCEYRRMSKPLCKWLPPSSLNELVFSFVIVASFYMFL